MYTLYTYIPTYTYIVTYIIIGIFQIFVLLKNEKIQNLWYKNTQSQSKNCLYEK